MLAQFRQQLGLNHTGAAKPGALKRYKPSLGGGPRRLSMALGSQHGRLGAVACVRLYQRGAIRLLQVGAGRRRGWAYSASARPAWQRRCD